MLRKKQDSTNYVFTLSQRIATSLQISFCCHLAIKFMMKAEGILFIRKCSSEGLSYALYCISWLLVQVYRFIKTSLIFHVLKVNLKSSLHTNIRNGRVCAQLFI